MTLGTFPTPPHQTPEEKRAEVDRKVRASEAHGRRLALQSYLERERDASLRRAGALAAAADDPADVDDVSRLRIDEFLADAESAERRLDALRSHSAAIVRSEPLTYHPAGPSFIADTVRSSLLGDRDSTERLDRHDAEMKVEMPRRQRRAAAEAAKARDTFGASFVEQRVEPNVTDGTGGFFSPPLWLVDEFSTAPRAERVVADLVPSRFPLPRGVSSINVPRLTTGVEVQGQVPNTGDPSADLVDSSTSSPVVTLSGEVVCSLQLLEQSPPGARFDQVTLKDGMASYDQQLEQMLVNGSGTSGSFTGLLNLSGTTAVTYTSGSPTGMAMFTYFGEVFAQVSDARDLPPECWLMRGARWAWLAASEDASQRPFLVPGPTTSPTLGANAPCGVGHLLGVPVFIDGAVPATLGGPGAAGGTQDAVLAVRPSDYLLFEEPEPTIDIIEDPTAAALSVRIRVRKYAAAILGRYPSGVGSVVGTGMTVQSGS